MRRVKRNVFGEFDKAGNPKTLLAKYLIKFIDFAETQVAFEIMISIVNLPMKPSMKAIDIDSFVLNHTQKVLLSSF